MSDENEVFGRLDREKMVRTQGEIRDLLKTAADNSIVLSRYEPGPYEPSPYEPIDVTPIADAVREGQSETADRIFEANWEATRNARELINVQQNAMDQAHDDSREEQRIHYGLALIGLRRMVEARKQSSDQIEATNGVREDVQNLGWDINAASEANVWVHESEGGKARENADANADRIIDTLDANTDRLIVAQYDVADMLMRHGDRLAEEVARRFEGCLNIGVEKIVGAIVTSCWNEAEEKFRQAAEHERFGRYGSALKELGAALQSDSTHSGANVLMGQIGFRLGETMLAREFFRRGMDYAQRCRRPGDYVRATICLAELELLVGNVEASLGILADAQTRAPRGWDLTEIREYPVQVFAFVWEGIRAKETFWMEILLREAKGFLALYPDLWERMLETPIAKEIVGVYSLIRFKKGAYARLAWALYEFQGFGLDPEDKAFHARLLSDLKKVDAGMTPYVAWYHECLLEIQRLEFRAGNSDGWCRKARCVWTDANELEAARVVEEARRAEAARVEVERQEAEKAKVARIAQRTAVKKKIREDERQKVEAAIQFAEQTRRAEAARIEDERLKADNRRREADRLDAKRVDAERKERERLEAERLEVERAEAVRIAEAERQAELRRLQTERAEAERLRQKEVEARAIAYRTRQREESQAYWQGLREAVARSLRQFLMSALVVGIALVLVTLVMLSVWITSK